MTTPNWPVCLILLLSAAAGACGDSTVEPLPVSSNVQVRVTASPGSIEPGRSFEAFVSVEPTGAAVVQDVRVEVSGLLASAETLLVNAGGNFSLSRRYVVPVTAGVGQVTVRAIARVADGVGQGATQVAVADTAAPTVNLAVTPSDSVFEPLDSIRVTASGADNVGLRALVIRLTGAVTLTDSVGIEGLRSASRLVALRLPRTIALGQTLTISAEVVDVGGHHVAATTITRRVDDLTPPTVTAGALNGRGSTSYAPGDTVRLILGGSDNVLLTQYGYRLSGGVTRADSFTVSDTVASRTVLLPVTAAWIGVSTFSVFAQDGSGNRQEVVGGTITVGTRSRRGVVSSSVRNVRDVAIDPKRQRIYVSQSDSNRVTVIDAATGAVLTPIAFSAGSSPRGLDLSLSGDSLLVALRNSNHLAVVNLVSGAQDTIRVNTDAFLSRGPDNVRVMGNGKALVSITFAGSGYGGSVVAVDLATRAFANRATVTEVVPLCRSGNRARLLTLVAVTATTVHIIDLW